MKRKNKKKKKKDKKNCDFKGNSSSRGYNNF